MNKVKTQRFSCGRLLILAACLALVCPSPSIAESVIQMNLRELVVRADKVFRGTVAAAIPGTLNAGGGQIPIITYRIVVDEAFKGDFQTVKGIRFVEMRVLGSLKPAPQGHRNISQLNLRLPKLEVGERYLLLTTRPSAIGMSSPVGLGQGCFRITGAGEGEEAVNDYGKHECSSGAMDQADLGARNKKDTTRVSENRKYSHVAKEIRRLVDEGRGRR